MYVGMLVSCRYVCMHVGMHVCLNPFVNQKFC